MANHGAVSVAGSLAKALDQLPYLEYICELQLKAMATGHAIKLLDAQEIDHVAGLLKSYGQKTD
jgi:L-fuculose-phosphate aldolase